MNRRLPRTASPADIQRARRWTMGVWLATLALVIVSCVPLYVQAGEREPHGRLAGLRVYAQDMSERMGLPKTAIVLEYQFGNKHQRGESRVGIKAGKRNYYVLIADTWLAHGNLDGLRNTVRHEICHLLTFEKLGRPTENGRFHGPTFKRCARKWGVGNNYIAD